MIKAEGVVPHVSIYRERVEFIGKNDHNNISILLWNITFEDGGQYTCFGRNPKEKGRNHSAIFNLIVVDECEWIMSVREGSDLFSFLYTYKWDLRAEWYSYFKLNSKLVV